MDTCRRSLRDKLADSVAQRLNLTVVSPAGWAGASQTCPDAPATFSVSYLGGAAALAQQSESDHGLNSGLGAVRVLESALRGALFRGSAAARLLSGIPHVLTFRVVTPLELENPEIRPRPDLEEALERQAIELQDDASLLGGLADFDGATAPRVDLELNMRRLSIESAVQIVVTACEGAAAAALSLGLRLLEARLLEVRLAATVVALREDEDLAGWQAPCRLVSGNVWRGKREIRSATSASGAGQDDVQLSTVPLRPAVPGPRRRSFGPGAWPGTASQKPGWAQLDLQRATVPLAAVLLAPAGEPIVARTRASEGSTEQQAVKALTQDA